jgi:hypothetical protein
MNQTPIRNLEGSAQFYDGEYIDTHAGSEHVMSSAEYYRERDIEQLGSEAAAAADRGVESYAQDGISEMETWLDNIARTGGVIAWARREALGEE